MISIDLDPRQVEEATAQAVREALTESFVNQIVCAAVQAVHDKFI
jgi:hypothetical protein